MSRYLYADTTDKTGGEKGLRVLMTQVNLLHYIA